MLTEAQIASHAIALGVVQGGRFNNADVISFARAIAAEQREANALICEEMDTHFCEPPVTGEKCAAAIRNQGEKTP